MKKGRLIFKYGTMNSSKSANLLMQLYEYQIKNKKVIAIKPALDTRSPFIETRAGITSQKCHLFNTDTDLYNYLKSTHSKNDIQYVFIDESQFLTKEQVKQLCLLTIEFNIVIYAYGLKNTFSKGKLFEGSEALLFYADKIEEIESSCALCNNKATQNLLLVDGERVYDGDIIKIGDVEGDFKYIPVCNIHYFKDVKGS